MAQKQGQPSLSLPICVICGYVILHCAAVRDCSLVALLHSDFRWHQQIVDSIKILSVEEANFDLAPAIRRLKYLHLRAEYSSQLRLSSFDIWVDSLRCGSPCWLLLARLLN